MEKLIFEVVKEIIKSQNNYNIVDTANNEEARQYCLKDKNCNFFDGERRIDTGFLAAQSKDKNFNIIVILSETFNADGSNKYNQLNISVKMENLNIKYPFQYNIHCLEDLDGKTFEKQYTSFLNKHNINSSKEEIIELCTIVAMFFLNINMNIFSVLHNV